MGRTNPTFRDQLREYEDYWQAYRRALRRRDQPHFDRLFEHAAAHADASGALNGSEPLYPILVSIALEHERRIVELEERIDKAGDEGEEREVNSAVQD